MSERVPLENFGRRVSEIREIALGIFDKNERRLLLAFVADAEKLAAESNTSRGRE